MSDFIQKLFTSLQNYQNGDSRIGELNRIWYDSIRNAFYISDGQTPGGILIGGGSGGGSTYTLLTATNVRLGGVKIGSGIQIDRNGVISVSTSTLIGPKGDTGPQGLIGNTGPQGLIGDTGPQGPTGDIGPQGFIGDTGPQGLIGDTGPQGPTGDIGPQGPTGDIGPQGLIGDTGPQGPIGDTGPQGPTGDTGPQGLTGTSGVLSLDLGTGTYGTLESQTLNLWIGQDVSTTSNVTFSDTSVNSLRIPVGSILDSNTSSIYTLSQLTLTNVVNYSQTSTDVLSIGEYGLQNGIPAPYAVYEFTQNPNPPLQVGDLLSGAGIPNILPLSSVGFTGTVVLAVGTGTWSNYVIGFSDYSNYSNTIGIPAPGIAVIVGRNTVNTNLAISTQPTTDIALFPGINGNIIVDSNIIPLTNDRWSLGSPGMRWRHIWVGAGTIYMLDETLGTDTAIGSKDGVVYLQGGVGLTVGEFTLIDNQIKIADPTRDIIIGVTTATGQVIFNRPLSINTPAGNTAFNVDRFGLTTIRPPTFLSSSQSALSIIGNISGFQQPRNFNNTMLQITGADNTSTRISIDAFGTGTYPVIAGRQAGGTVTNPTRTVNGDTLFRISTQGWGDTGYLSAIGRIQVQALQDFTDTTAGTRVRFQLTPINTTTIQPITADITATGLSFVGNPIGGITFRDGSFQYTAYTNTNVITNIHAGTGTHVSSSTGDVTIWVDTSPKGEKILFSYSDLPLTTICNVSANSIIVEIRVIILTAFNDITSTLSIGTLLDTQELLDITDILPQGTGTYTTEPAHKYTTNTELVLAISAGSSTQGNGMVIIYYE